MELGGPGVSWDEGWQWTRVKVNKMERKKVSLAVGQGCSTRPGISQSRRVDEPLLQEVAAGEG